MNVAKGRRLAHVEEADGTEGWQRRRLDDGIVGHASSSGVAGGRHRQSCHREKASGDAMPNRNAGALPVAIALLPAQISECTTRNEQLNGKRKESAGNADAQ